MLKMIFFSFFDHSYFIDGKIEKWIAQGHTARSWQIGSNDSDASVLG